MAALPDLNAVAIAEKDDSGEFLWTWVYPKLDSTLKTIIIRKCQALASDEALAEALSSCCGHSENSWYYIVTGNSINLALFPKVAGIFVAVVSKNFNPELYFAIGHVFASAYSKTGSPVAVLHKYLALFTKGTCERDDGRQLCSKDFDEKKAYLQTCIRELVRLFGMETILLYVGVLLKKRIVVYASKLSTLIDVCRSLPALVIHRLNWDIVYPFTHLVEDELALLSSQRHYVAGFTDASIETRLECYDLFVNVTSGEIVVNPASKEYFQMGKFHKDLASYMVDAVRGEQLSDHDVIKELSARTKDVIANLKSLDQEHPLEPKISLSMLQERKLTPSMQSFLLNLASAEGLIRL